MSDMTRIVKGVVTTAIDLAADRAKRLTATVADTVADTVNGHGSLGRTFGAVRGFSPSTLIGPGAGAAPGPAAPGTPPAGPAAPDFAATADALRGIGTEVGTLLRKHPVPTLLIAVGAGMLLNRLARDART